MKHYASFASGALEDNSRVPSRPSTPPDYVLFLAPKTRKPLDHDTEPEAYDGSWLRQSTSSPTLMEPAM